MVEYIKDQGERLGTAELEYRLTAIDAKQYHGHGNRAAVVRKYARTAWIAKPTNKQENHHAR